MEPAEFEKLKHNIQAIAEIMLNAFPEGVEVKMTVPHDRKPSQLVIPGQPLQIPIRVHVTDYRKGRAEVVVGRQRPNA